MATARASLEKNSKQLLQLLETTVRNAVPKQRLGLLFSAGIDSLLLALLLKKMKLKFTCFFGFVEGIGKPKDLEFAVRAAKKFGLKLETNSKKIGELPALLPRIIPIIKSNNPVSVGIALPLFLACEKAKQKGIKTIFSGQGADELFYGYSRFKKTKNLKKESRTALNKLLKKDLQWNNAIASSNNLQLALPFLNQKIINFSKKLPEKFKISGEGNKIILRQAALYLGTGEEFAERKKVAAQYGSNADKAIEKLAKQSGAKGKTEYLSRFTKEKKMKIAALFSGGKDSCLALWKMQQQGYDICCLVSILPARSDSFMYHRPEKKVLEMQSKALGIPLIVEKTRGEKEKELAELKKALIEAKKSFGVQGVVSGALYSNYQRERAQTICDSLQLKLFSPLWHKKQEEELRELVDNGFVFVFTKVAAMGLGKEWLGKQIGKKEITELKNLNEKIGLNVAGEGGEFESLVLEAPNYCKRIRIVSAQTIMKNEFTGELKIKKTVLEEKSDKN